MASVLLDLEQSPAAPLGRGWMMLMGVINLLQACFLQNFFRYFDLVFGFALVAGGFYYWKFYTPRCITFDEAGSRGKIGIRTHVRLLWDEISKVGSSLYSITIRTKSGETLSIDLSAITFQQHKEVKPRILELARSKGMDAAGS